MRKQILIYDRWLHVLGGGERYVGELAAALGRTHDVTLLTHRAVDRATLERALQLDLGRVGLVTVPYRSDNRAVMAASEPFDLFVNGSHRDFFVPRARTNALVVYFPADPLSAVPPLEYPRWLRPRRLLQRVWIEDGFSPIERVQGREARWIGRTARLRAELPSRPPRARLRLVLRGSRLVEGQPTRLRITVDGRPQRDDIVLTRDRWVSRRVTLPLLGNGRQTGEVALETAATAPLGDHEREVAIAELWLESGLRLPFERWLQRGRVAHGPIAMVREPARELPRVLDAHQVLLPISEYARYWMQRLWLRDGAVLYPAAAVDEFPPLAKRPQILSVGRFFPGQHNKKHLPMIQAFKRLIDEGLRGWEYHLAGGLKAEDPGHAAYLRRLTDEARGYPIRFHVNASIRTLRELYGACRIFWHGSGFGEDPALAPELFEHFGITPVEAMAAGSVPIVFGAAGPAEVVRDGESGLHWRTLDELRAATCRVIDHPMLERRLVLGARARCRDFSRSAFESRVQELLGPLLGC